MVSIRRRRLLALYSGKNYSPVERPKSDSGSNSDDPTPDSKSVSVYRLPTADVSPPKDTSITKSSSASPTLSASSSSKEEQNEPFSGKEVKRRKRHRRKLFQDQEPCVMRGVYFKNMKWQAAIKVDKKQIHLGTVGSQEEAAHLYDRAAFMCGREPNFELTEEEKQELSQFKWDEFLAMTRNAITKKKHRRRLGAEAQKEESETPLENAEWDDEQGGVPAAEEDAEPESSDDS